MASSGKASKRGADEKARKGAEAPPPARSEEAEAVEHFVRGVLSRGEAAAPDKEGNLPPGVTHEIVESEDGEAPTIRRRRFSVS